MGGGDIMIKKLFQYALKRISLKDAYEALITKVVGDLSEEEKAKIKEEFKKVLVEAGKTYLTTQL